MRIVITGASGNVGTALVRRLSTATGHELVGVVRRPPASGFAEMGWVTADLTQDSSLEALRAACTGADAVVHLAWGFQPSHDLAHLGELGIGGTRRVLEAVRDTGVSHLVHLSSVGAYSPKRDDRPVDESWPTDGVPTSPYSQHKAAAERHLDTFERDVPGTLVTRLRPGIIGQRSAGSALLRYGLPGLVPATVLDLLPVLPLDRSLSIPVVHADDVADAIERVLHARVRGAFNLAAAPPVTRAVVAEVLGARPVHVPARALRATVSAAWHARLLQLDPGWIDLAFAVPLLDTSRAVRELGWTPSTDAVSTLRETVAGMSAASSDATPVLRPRTVLGAVRDAVLRKPVSNRARP
ncbi:MAG: NAD-dependent epimerase/dehydratase [Marmoricola sp.]|jgi:UDP-glucose 4-epimerase|nr:NAD-dependent epimerase/dehydratase [Marmoricola sp.]